MERDHRGEIISMASKVRLQIHDMCKLVLHSTYKDGESVDSGVRESGENSDGMETV